VGWDIKKCVKDLKAELWDNNQEPTDRQIVMTENRILNACPHHCGDHSGCTDPKCCGFIKMKLEKGFALHQALTKEENEELKERSPTKRDALVFNTTFS
jgi:hypothetical protein